MGRREVAVLSGAYLEGAESKKETIRRLTEITTTLSTTEVSPSTHRTLSSLPPTLVSSSYLSSPDKQIRLHTVLACMELFYVYAPSPPWDDEDTLSIFDQTIRQLGNLAHCTPSNKLFDLYFRILEMLSEIKIGVVLVDLIQTAKESRKRAEETLQELIKTLLAGVHVDHPPEVRAHAENSIVSCLEEFESVIPIGVLDELLLAIGQGPILYVHNPEYSKAVAKKKKELPPKEVQQTNCAYLVAAKVIRKAEDKISSPMAALLNGLLGGDDVIVRETSISCFESEEWGVKKKGTIAAAIKEEVNVYSITYELHRIAPNILTTVIGTVASSLVSGDVAARGRATKLLGKLFGARTSDVARRFGPCFREWLMRSMDPDAQIRETMVKCLINFLANKHAETELCNEVNSSLANMINNEPVLDIRLLAIHQTCDLVHNATYRESDGNARQSIPPISVISSDLMMAIGNRVGSKNKTEHRDAITGLSQIYHRHYLKRKLAVVQEGGDDVNIGEILETLRVECLGKKKQDTKFAWIPQKVFECVYFSDASDPEMRNRLYQIVDDILLGSSKSTSLSQTSRAVGLSMILHSLKNKENAKKWMCTLFAQRANLQRALGSYLDARLKAKNCEADSAEAFTADADAMEKLEVIASYTALIGDSGSPLDQEARHAVLKKFHAAKDKHIFRILSTIASPLHSPSARARAFDELPKRTKSLGNDTSTWVKSLARRCAMGSFFNTAIIEHCIILSQESFEAGDCEVSSLFLDCVKTASSVFPALAATEEGFKNITEFFESSRTSSVTHTMKKDMEKFDLVTSLSDILAKAASSRSTSNVETHNQTIQSTEALRTQLLRLCTRDGTPEQARNSVLAISSLINPNTKSTDLASRIQEEKEEFLPVLKALVNPSRLSIPDDESNYTHKSRIISVLSAIAAISECAPYAFNAAGEGGKKGWGQRALDFALGTVLLGKRQSLSTSIDADDESESDDEDESPNKKAKKREPSVHSRMVCCAIEVLVSHIRSTVMKLKLHDTRSNHSYLKAPSTTYLNEVFGVLVKIIEDGGVPPSCVNGRFCKSKEDQTELRRCATVNLIRLSDSSLQLEQKYLTPRMWHIMSSAVLDKEPIVRGAVMEELAHMYTGSKFAPSLRFVALVSLCVDGDNGHHSANGYAANVGRRSTSIKVAATQCIRNLRVTFQSTQAQCRSYGRDAEKNFENNYKMKVMPEYSVPYALHLLAFRHETPGAAGALSADDSLLDDDELANAEASQKVLKKRLKWLFDPLIQSLGDSADNISFLLRMIELIGKHPPIDVKNTSNSSLEIGFDDESVDEHDANEAAARMQVICQFARESLLSYVKKDVNLTVYPGSIAVPADLYAPRMLTKSKPLLEPNAKKAPAPIKTVDIIFEDDKNMFSPKAAPLAVYEDPLAKNDVSSAFGYDRPKISPTASPVLPDTQDFDKDLDVSPIAPVKSPSKPLPREVKKHTDIVKTNKKRKSSEIKPFDEFPSPSNNEKQYSFLSSHGSSEKAFSRRSKKSKTTPVTTVTTGDKKSTSSKKSSKPTPVSIESKAMMNITNKTSSVHKSKRSSKKAMSQSADDEFDFSNSPVKVTSAKRSRKAPSLVSDKAHPVRKAPAKVGKAKKMIKSSQSTSSSIEPIAALARQSSRRSAGTRA